MRIKLTALDTLFFRDGKPFNRGEETWANGIFPPPPSVIYGALRSLYFTSHPQYIGKENTPNDPTQNLVITDIQLSSENNLYYPCPLDIVAEKSTVGTDDDVNYLQLELGDTKRITSSTSKLSHHLSIKDNIEVETIDNDYISKRSFEKKYLAGGIPTSTFSLDDFFLTSEPKVGIGRENTTRVSQDGLLYRVGMIRPEKRDEKKGKYLQLNIEVEFELDGWNLSAGSRGFLKMGGEGKSCSFEVIASKERLKNEALSSDVFKICFSTPTVFRNKTDDKISGWVPSFLNENLEGTWNGVKVKLIAAAIGKPKYLGGFDMKKRKPKPMLKMIPEGSVYYFKLVNKNDLKELKNIHQPFKLIDEPTGKGVKKSDKRANQGFGLAYLANV